MAVETNTIITADVAPAISIDLVSNFVSNIRALQELLGITDMIPMAEGSTVKVYTTTVGNLVGQDSEGDIVGLTDVEIAEADPIVMELLPYRKRVTAQAIQKVGRERAIYDTDRALIGKIRSAIKAGFYTALGSASGVTPAGATLQQALANAWAQLHTYFEDFDINPVHFVNPLDVAGYLGTASITTQTAFGFDYVEDFLGLGTVIFSPNVTQGEIISTAKENLRCAYVPANGAVGQEFEMTADESGLVGVTHGRVLDHFSIDSLMMCGVKFFAENLAGVFVGAVGEDVSA